MISIILHKKPPLHCKLRTWLFTRSLVNIYVYMLHIYLSAPFALLKSFCEGKICICASACVCLSARQCAENGSWFLVISTSYANCLPIFALNTYAHMSERYWKTMLTQFWGNEMSSGESWKLLLHCNLNKNPNLLHIRSDCEMSSTRRQIEVNWLGILRFACIWLIINICKCRQVFAWQSVKCKCGWLSNWELHFMSCSTVISRPYNRERGTRMPVFE